MKLTSKLAVFGGILAGVGAVALTLLKRKQNEEIYHEAEIKAMDELDKMMDQGDECEGCTCVEECAAAKDSEEAPAEEKPETAEEAPAEEAPEAAEATGEPAAEAEPEAEKAEEAKPEEPKTEAE